MKPHILIVEDEIEVRRVSAEMLELLNYEVSQAGDAPEALEYYRKDPLVFDLLMLDLNLPSMTGLALLEEIRKMAPDQKVVLCSGDTNYVPKDDQPPCLYKPYRMAELKSMIEALLKG